MRVEKIIVGVPTFGNVGFTKMTIDHIKKTVKTPYELMVVVGKPGDSDTVKLCRDQNIYYVKHTVNKGLPAEINDMYDYAFRDCNYDALVVVGNDVLPYWESIDKLVKFANESEYDWISGTCVTSNGLISKIPSVASYFNGGEKNKNFFGSSLPEWLDKYKPSDKEMVVDLDRFKIIGDSHNLCLFTKHLFEEIGYVDVNFYPAYYEDNDYSHRAQLAKLKMCRLQHVKYFHFWSRTIHQGNMKSTNDKYFPLNKSFYIQKWGGEPGKEKFSKPLYGSKGHINITSRANEDKIIQSWISK